MRLGRGPRASYRSLSRRKATHIGGFVLMSLSRGVMLTLAWHVRNSGVCSGTWCALCKRGWEPGCRPWGASSTLVSAGPWSGMSAS